MKQGMLTVKQARNLAGKTQAEAAAAIGVCVETYRKMEKAPDNMTIGQVKRFCREVGCKAGEIGLFEEG